MEHEDAWYLVTSVEYSGLESRPGNEVYQSGNDKWRGPVRILLEAEDGRYGQPFEEKIDMVNSSNGYHIASRDGKPDGRLVHKADLPMDGEYILWARVKDLGKITVIHGGEAWGSIAGPPDAWSWQKLGNPKHFLAGEAEIEFVSEAGSEKIDKLLITNDLLFMPKGKMVLDTEPPGGPEGLQGKPVSPNTIALSWIAPADRDISHYNVYSSPRKHFICSRGNLIGSPIETEFVDWGLVLNTPCFYKVTAVDRSGNESLPVPVLEVEPSAFTPVEMYLRAGEASLTRIENVYSPGLGDHVLQATEGNIEGQTALWEIYVPRDGEYSIWGLSIHQENNGASFRVKIDEEKEIFWKVYGVWRTWGWSPFGNKVAGSPELFHLKAGRHSIRLDPQTDSSSVSRIVITDNPSYWPVTDMKSTGY